MSEVISGDSPPANGALRSPSLCLHLDNGQEAVSKAPGVVKGRKGSSGGNEEAGVAERGAGQGRPPEPVVAELSREAGPAGAVSCPQSTSPLLSCMPVASWARASVFRLWGEVTALASKR